MVDYPSLTIAVKEIDLLVGLMWEVQYWAVQSLPAENLAGNNPD